MRPSRSSLLVTVGFLAALAWLSIDVLRVRAGDSNTILMSSTLVLIYSLGIGWRSFRSRQD